MASLPKLYKIKRIVDETPSIKTFFLDATIDMKPGQFFMVWLPGVDEKPFTLSYSGKNPAVTIRRHGKGTQAFHNLKVGDKIGLRGPFGNGFSIDAKRKRVAIVAGGIGMIALATLAEALPNATIICGAKTKSEMVFSKRFNIISCTDDGTCGEKLFSPQVFENMLSKGKMFDYVYTCGPEVMMKAMVEICTRKKIPMEASLERYMKCGMGVCASCVCGNQLVCKDGPVFTAKQLLEMDDFGKFGQLMSGKKVVLKEYYSWLQK